MNKESANRLPLVRINWERLRHFLVRCVAGLGILQLWFVLTAVVVFALIYTFNIVSSLQGINYVASVALIPIGLFCWWVCYLLSLEFFTEIGIELNGGSRLIVLPIAIPVVTISFILSLWVSAGETITNKYILAVSLLLGAIMLTLFTGLII